MYRKKRSTCSRSACDIMNGTFVESRNISCSITVDFARGEGYIVIEQLVNVHCSFLYFKLVSTIN